MFEKIKFSRCPVSQWPLQDVIILLNILIWAIHQDLECTPLFPYFNGQFLLQPFFLCIHEHYRQVNFVQSRSQDESLQVTISKLLFFNLHKGWLSIHMGHPFSVPIRRTSHLSSAIPANDTQESVFGHRNCPRRERGSNLVPLAPEESAITTEQPLWPSIFNRSTVFL